MQAKLMFLHALSPLHAGTGQGVGAIDLPIAREKGTDIPIVPGSSLKGVLRDACKALHGNGTCTRIFGPDTNSAHEHAGAVVLTDLRLVALPVRSLAGVFAWVSSPFLLKRLARDAQLAGQANVPTGLTISNTDAALVSDDSALRLNDDVILEDVKLAAQADADAWAGWLAKRLFPDDGTWQTEFNAHFCIVHDDVMAYLLQVGTDVTARIRLKDDEKTVDRGALWYEEALPAESILAGLVAAQPNGKAEPDEVFQIIGELAGHPHQVGGNATVGRGLCRLSIV
ncbi:MAG TPA: type III-B CRISPR module RAMP protein Cmr4 [Candidatus Tenderia sp.]|nr:type III-B CRISPR module RAMP protein Cmr4 [Candidatus Tenderia sp.]